MAESRVLTLADLPELSRRFAAELPGRSHGPEDLKALFTEILTSVLATPETPPAAATHLLLEGWLLQQPPGTEPHEGDIAAWPRRFAGWYLLDRLPCDRDEVTELLNFMEFVGGELDPDRESPEEDK